MSKANKRGRPKAEQPLKMKCIRVTDEDWELWQQAATIRGKTPSEFVRRTMNRAAKRTVSAHNRKP